LSGIPPSALQSQIKGDFGNQGEEEQPSRVFSGISRVEKPFHKEKAENRKGKSSDVSGNRINQPQPLLPERILRGKEQASDNRSGGMINQHREDGDQLYRAAGNPERCLARFHSIPPVPEKSLKA